MTWTIIFAVALGLFANIIISFLSDFDHTIIMLRKAKIEQLLIPFLLYIACYVIDSIRLIFMSSRFNHKLSFRDAFYNNVLGAFVSNLTPSASGGQPLQILHLRATGLNSKISTNIIISRFLEFMIYSTLIVMLFFYKVVGIIGEGMLGSKFLIIGLVASTLITFMIALMFFFPKLLFKIVHFFMNLFQNKNKTVNAIKKFETWINDFRGVMVFLWKENFWAVLLDMILGGLAIFIQSYSLYYVFNVFVGMKVSPFDMMLIFILLNLVAYYVPTPGAAGGIEGVYTLILSGIVGQSSLVAAGIFIWRFATFYMHLLFEVIVVLFYNRKSKEKAIIN